MEAHPPAQPAPPPDGLGRALRRLAGSAALRAGILAALGTVVVTGAAVLLLSLVPWAPLQEALTVETEAESVPTQGRIARSLLFPWLAQTTVSGEDFVASLRTLAPLPTLVLLVVLVLAGVLVRRLVPRSASERAAALAVTAAAAAVAVAVLAATLGFGVEDVEFGFSPGLFLAVALVEVVVVGAFAFGLVALAPAVLRVPARTAAILAGGVFALGVVAFPLLVVTGPSSGASEGRDAVLDAAGLSVWAPGAASATLPLALGASAHLEPSEFGPPFRRTSDDDFGQYEYWPGLASYADAHASARLWGYTDAGGAAWNAALVGGALLLVVLWTLGTIRAVRALGAPRTVDGLARGALVGLFGALLLAVVAWLSRLTLGVESSNPFLVVEQEQLWGMSAGGTALAAVVLVLLTAAVGAVYAALGPSPYRAAPWSPAAALAGRMWPEPRDPNPPA